MQVIDENTIRVHSLQGWVRNKPSDCKIERVLLIVVAVSEKLARNESVTSGDLLSNGLCNNLSLKEILNRAGPPTSGTVVKVRSNEWIPSDDNALL